MKTNKLGLIIVDVVVLVILLLVPVIVTNYYWLGAFTSILISILLAVSFWLITTTGQVNLGHAAFAAIGGYMSAAFITAYGWNSWLALPLGVVTSGVIALIIGAITLRITGIYFIIATVALCEVTKIVFGMWEHPFGGLIGLINLRPPDPLALPGLPVIEFTRKPELYYLVLVFVVLGVAVVRRLSRSSFGLIFKGIQYSDSLAEHVGVNIMGYKVLAFVVGSMCAGLGGVLYTYVNGSMLPTSFTMNQSNYYMVWNAVGGLGYFGGAIVGTAVLSMLSEFLRPVKEFEPIIYAVLLISAVLFFRAGLWGAGKKIWDIMFGGEKQSASE